MGGLQDDGTPNQLHVITDAATGKKLFEYQGIENATGTGKTLYSGTVSLDTTLSGTTYSLTDATRGGHKTYNLKHGTSGTGTLFTQTTNTWGTGTASSSTTDVTAAADAPTAPRRRGTSTRTRSAAAASRTTVSAPTPACTTAVRT